ncbi:hypothetical protein BH11BAC2_BH11BAC2_01920 [soil metagenome]
MKTPRKIIFLIALVVGFCAIASTTIYAQSNDRIKIIIGLRSHANWLGYDCEGNKGMCFAVNVFNRNVNISNSGIGEISITGDKMLLNILEDSSPATNSENYFYVYEDKILESAIAEQLGYTTITIKKGTYPLNKSKNRFGSVELNVVTH